MPDRLTGARRSRWVTLLLIASCSDPITAEPKRGAEITPAHRQLSQKIWNMRIEDQPPLDGAPLGGTGLKLDSWLLAAGEQQAYLNLSALEPDDLARRCGGLASRRQIATLTALLDHHAPEVREASLRALRNSHDPRVVPGVLAAAKHNAFELNPGDAFFSLRQRYRRALATTLRERTRIAPYEGPAPSATRTKIYTFDFGRLDQWLEVQVLRARQWPR